ncbi:MAG: hypothetical protein GY765_20345 [bacterium]|nr:hypothetical protein [bacterium]
MIEKVKNFIASLASLTALFYAAGYIAEQSHARMLGISVVHPAKDYYLVAGGQFFLSTLYALHSALKPGLFFFLIFPLFFGFVFLIFQYENDAPGISGHPKKYSVIIAFIFIILMLFAIPRLTSPFVFSDFLLQQAETGLEKYSFFARELRTWVLNDNETNKQKLICFYVSLILSTSLSAAMLWSMIKQWKKGIFHEHEPALENSSSGSWQTRVKSCFHRYCFGLLIVLMGVIVAVQTFAIPINYGILLKSNYYPEVKVEVKTETVKKSGSEIVEPVTGLLENNDPAREYKLWLLRENSGEMLFYAVYYEKGASDDVYKLQAVKRDAIRKIEIVNNSFIFKFN